MENEYKYMAEVLKTLPKEKPIYIGGHIETPDADSVGSSIALALYLKSMGYDAKDERMSGTPNQMNIQSMYSDIDLDANDTETELQASFEDILWFVNCHLANTGQGNFEGQEVNIIFNRDMMMNESEIIDNVIKSQGIVSDETLLGMHPWIDDVELELERLQKQKEKEQAEMAAQYDPFGQMQNKTDPAAKGNQGGDIDEE